MPGFHARFNVSIISGAIVCIFIALRALPLMRGLTATRQAYN